MVKGKPGAHLRLDWGRIFFRAHVVVGRIRFPCGGGGRWGAEVRLELFVGWWLVAILKTFAPRASSHVGFLYQIQQK